jgi:multiple sugar transport system substrate-binding protein
MYSQRRLGKTTIVLTGVLLVAVLCAGAVFAGGEAKEEKVQLNIAVLVGVYGARAKELEASFEEEYQNIDLVIEELPYDDVIKKELLDCSQNTGRYDVITMTIPELAIFAHAGHITPLDSFLSDPSLTSPDLDLDDYYDAYLEGSKYKGKTYGMPYQFWLMAYFYRKDLFADPKHKRAFKRKYGYELGIPEDYTQFYDTAEFFTMDRDNDGSVDLYGFGMDGLKGGGGCNVFQWVHFLWNAGGDIFDENYRPVVNSREGIQATSYYASLVAFSPPDWVTNMCDENTSLFQQDMIAQSIHDSDQFGYINDPESSQPQVVNNVAMATPPVGLEGKPVIHLVGWVQAVNDDSEHKEEAFQYIQWMAAKGRAPVQAKYGEPQCRESWLNDPANQRKYPEYKGMVGALPYARTFPSIPEIGEVLDILALEIQNACLGQKSAEAAMNDANNKIESVLRQAGYY